MSDIKIFILRGENNTYFLWLSKYLSLSRDFELYTPYIINKFKEYFCNKIIIINNYPYFKSEKYAKEAKEFLLPIIDDLINSEKILNKLTKN